MWAPNISSVGPLFFRFFMRCISIQTMWRYVYIFFVLRYLCFIIYLITYEWEGHTGCSLVSQVFGLGRVLFHWFFFGGFKCWFLQKRQTWYRLWLVVSIISVIVYSCVRNLLSCYFHRIFPQACRGNDLYHISANISHHTCALLKNLRMFWTNDIFYLLW